MTYIMGHTDCLGEMVMLEPVLGSLNCERVLLFLLAREEGYAREIARHFETDLTPIQKQLEKLEVGGILVSRLVGRTRLYAFNPRYPFMAELRALLAKALTFYPQDEQERLTLNRRRAGYRNIADLDYGVNPVNPKVKLSENSPLVAWI